MERSERIRLESIRTRLLKDIAAIDELLKTASAPRTRSDADIKRRALEVCTEIRRRGGSVSSDELRQIVSKRGMPFPAVGALFSGEYLANGKKGVCLGSRGRSVVTRRDAVSRRPGKPRRRLQQ